MAGDVSASNIRIGANITDLLEGMKKASAAVRGMTLDMNSKLADSYKRAGKEQAVFRGGLLKLGDDLQGLAGKMAMFGTLPAIFAAGKSYKDFGELEKLEKGLTRYGETIQNVREIAKLPNVGVFDAAKNLIGLKAMKMESDLATRSIKAFANAITDAGGSAIDLDPALVNLKQFKSTRNINQVDLRQLANRIPQTMDAMQSAFKTTEAEKLNKIMAKLGTDGFIEKFIAELEKIPPAAGGAATAQEQLGDSALFFSGTMGKGADATYGITDAIRGLGGILDNLSTNFTNLTPEAQKSIFAIGGLAIAMPVVIGAVGGLIKLLPLLATGFGLISGPILGVIAVTGIAAAAIITNWDSVKKFLTESTWWETFSGIAKSGLGIVTELFKVVVNLIQGDWGNLGTALVNIMKNTWNLVLSTVAGGVKGVIGLFGAFNEAIGFEALGKGLSTFVHQIDGFVGKFKFDVPDSVGFAKKGIDAVTGSITNGTPPAKKLAGAVGEAAEAYVKMSEAAFKMWQIDIATKWYEEQKQLKDKIQGYKELLGVTANLNVEILKSQSMKFGGPDLGKLAGPASGIGESIGKINQSYSQTAEGIRWDAALDLNDYFGGKKDLGEIKAYFDKIPQIAGESARAYAEKLGNFVSETEELSNKLTGALQDTLVSFGTGFGEMLGDLMTNSGGLAQFVNNVIGSLASMMKDMGKALMGAGVAGIAFKSFMNNPAMAIAAGVGLTAIGQLLGNNLKATQENMSKGIPHFAEGAFAYNKMTAVVGDNRNARFDPEMIAPYSKVDRSIKKSIQEVGNGGSSVFIPNLEIRGEDFLVVFERAERTRFALR